MNQALVDVLDGEVYQEILRDKWRMFNANLNEQLWSHADKALRKQAEYARQDLFVPLKITKGDESYLFLQINAENFVSSEQKEQFIKEISFLRKVDFQLHKQQLVSLADDLGTYQPTSNNVLPLIQIFTNVSKYYSKQLQKSIG